MNRNHNNLSFFQKLKLFFKILKIKPDNEYSFSKRDILFLDMCILPRIYINTQDPNIRSHRLKIISNIIEILINKKDPKSYVNINNGPDILKKYVKIAKYEGNPISEKYFIRQIYLKKCWKLYCKIRSYYLMEYI